MTYTLSELFDLVQQPLPYPGGFSGRGVVISAGGPFLPCAYIAVRSLRHFGCTLPVQIWHLGSAELPSAIVPAFEQWGVTFVDSFEVCKQWPVRRLGGWENKPYAIMHSPFEEVLLIDADNMVLQDPTSLFDSPLYRTNGSLFWSDFIPEGDPFWAIRPGAWKLLSLSPEVGAEIESGQLLIDKRRCWKPLAITMHMNENAEFFYKECSHGDKDTFTLSWRLAGVASGLAPFRPRLTCDPVRLHFDEAGVPLFQHSRKWGFPAGNNPSIESFLLEAECFEWLRELERDLETSSPRSL